MDMRGVKPLLRPSLAEWQEEEHWARRRAIAVLRAGLPVQDFERARAYSSKVSFFRRIAEHAKQVLEEIRRAVRELLWSSPPLIPPYVSDLLAVPMLSVPALSESVDPSRTPHAPPCSLLIRSSVASLIRGRNHG